MKFMINNEETTFDICRFMKQSGELQFVYAITFRSESALKVQIEEILGVEALAGLIMNFENDFIEGMTS